MSTSTNGYYILGCECVTYITSIKHYSDFVYTIPVFERRGQFSFVLFYETKLPENIMVQEAVEDHKHRSKSKRKSKNKQTKNEAREELIKELSLPGNERKAKKIIKMIEKKKKKTERRTGKNALITNIAFT